MSLKVEQCPNTWYFSNGVFTEHMQALYKPEKNELTIIGLRHLPQVIRYLQKLGINELTLKWYPEDKERRKQDD